VTTLDGAIPAEVREKNAGLIADIDDLVSIHGTERSALLPILEGLKSRRDQITDIAIQVVADRLGLTPVDVEGVVTFYHFLGTEPTGDTVIHVCRTISCALLGMDAVVKRLENVTGVSMGETTPDGKVTIDWANCIGMCDFAPAALVNREAVKEVTPDRIAEIVTEARA
jgi:NADH:ubiquinone oxidoreductase subunit E